MVNWGNKSGLIHWTTIQDKILFPLMEYVITYCGDLRK